MGRGRKEESRSRQLCIQSQQDRGPLRAWTGCLFLVSRHNHATLTSSHPVVHSCLRMKLVLSHLVTAISARCIQTINGHSGQWRSIRTCQPGEQGESCKAYMVASEDSECGAASGRKKLKRESSMRNYPKWRYLARV
jgi:hypothetical protein